MYVILQLFGFFFNDLLWLSLFLTLVALWNSFSIGGVTVLSVCVIQSTSLPLVSHYCANQQVAVMRTGRQGRSTHGCKRRPLFYDEGNAFNTLYLKNTQSFLKSNQTFYFCPQKYHIASENGLF